MELPPLAPVPPPAVRSKIQSEEWEACLDAWVMLLEIRIEAPDKQFKAFAPKDESAVSFLSSYYQQLATSGASHQQLHAGSKSRSLQKLSFLLTRRFLLEQLSTTPLELLDWKFLGDMCCCYPSSAALRKLLSETWDKHEDIISSSLKNAKSFIIKQLSLVETLGNPDIISDFRRLTILASALPAAGHVLMTGSDYLDTLFEAYQTQKKREEVRKVLVANVYVGLTSLLKGPKANMSLLLDQLFGLKAAAGVGTPRVKKEPTLLSDLICSSDLLIRLEKHSSLHPQKRAQDLIASLRSYQTESKSFHHRYQRQRKIKSDKGKGRASDDMSLRIPEELHAHKMSLVTQIQDLFPDLGSGYIVRLLDFYHDSPETIIAHLLDDSLAPELQPLDKSEPLPTTKNPLSRRDPLSPQPTPPEIPSPRDPQPVAFTRRNVFDADVDIAEDGARGQLRFGRANPDLTADALLADRSQHAANKAAIISALATFDSDDDERDDTYDVADVGGTVDLAPGGADAEADADMRTRRNEEIELALFRTYKSTPGLFARDASTRRSPARGTLKRETGMTDEAIEGWAVMLARDPKRLARLEDKLALGVGGAAGGALMQPDLPATSYRKPGPEMEDDSDDDGAVSRDGGGRGRGRGGGRGPGRGRGRGRGGGGDNTPLAHQRKEQNKANRANHNRRNQRAKKIARGGGLPG